MRSLEWALIEYALSYRKRRRWAGKDYHVPGLEGQAGTGVTDYEPRNTKAGRRKTLP